MQLLDQQVYNKATAPTPTAAIRPMAYSAVARGAQFADAAVPEGEEPDEAAEPVGLAPEALVLPPVVVGAAPTPAAASVTPRAEVTRDRAALCWLRMLDWRSESRLENQEGAAVAVKGATPEIWMEANTSEGTAV